MKIINPATEEIIKEITEDNEKTIEKKFQLLNFLFLLTVLILKIQIIPTLPVHPILRLHQDLIAVLMSIGLNLHQKIYVIQ